MSEIEKMYENAGIETNKYKLCCTGCKHIAKLEVINGYPSKWICDKYDEVADCDRAEPEYPPFTAEKLINLVMFLINKGDFDIKKGSVDITFESFTSCIAGLINNLWQDLTPEEKQQIKEILE